MPACASEVLSRPRSTLPGWRGSVRFRALPTPASWSRFAGKPPTAVTLVWHYDFLR